MSATILLFPRASSPLPAAKPELTRQWTEQHLPLDQLATQLDKLGTHVGDVVSALAMTAMRIRTTMATGGAGA